MLTGLVLIWLAGTTSSGNAVNQPPKVSILFPPPCCVTISDGPLRIRADASAADGAIRQVVFYAEDELIGIVTNAPYNIFWTPDKNTDEYPQWRLTAVAIDNSGLSSTSAPARIRFRQPPTGTPSMAITAPTNDASFAAPATLLFAADLLTTDGIDNPVDFLIGTNVIGTVTNAPYSLVVTTLPEGRYELSVRTVGGVFHQTGYSAPIGVNVGKRNNNPPTVKLIGSPIFGIFYLPATLRLSAVSNDSDGTIAQVEFFIGKTSIGIARDPPYSLTLSNFVFAEGMYDVYAVATDDQGTSVQSQADGISFITGLPDPIARIELPGNGAFYSPRDTIPVVAYVVRADNNINPVEFLLDSVVVDATLGPPYLFAVRNLTVGTHTLAARIKDLDGSESRGQVFSITVADPVLVAPQLRTDRQFQFEAQGLIPRAPLSLQSSTDLVHWIEIQQTILATNKLTLFDSTATNYSRRFYRVRLGP
ncbi:MAG: Ig-like domain-containing protein [Verrucomicrobia bacterium]|nr:Ig-like domain-containing protein [Verrucomicrobiota bacterium]